VAIWSDPETGAWLEVPDHLPEDWEDG
jgi:hypothetical protein